MYEAIILTRRLDAVILPYHLMYLPHSYLIRILKISEIIILYGRQQYQVNWSANYPILELLYLKITRNWLSTF